MLHNPPCTRFSTRVRPTSRPNDVRWLTALHVAYKENHGEVRKQLDSEIRRKNPALVLVTTQNKSSHWMYNPKLTFPNYSRVDVPIIQGDRLAFRGEFPATSRFRKRIYNDHVGSVHNELSNCDVSLAINHLTRWPTRWVTSASSNASCAIYMRK